MLRSLQAFESCTIGATDGDIGRVKNLYFDDHAWTIRYLVVDAGSWLSGRKVLVSPTAIHKPDWPSHRLPAELTQEQVRNSPDIDTDKPVSRQQGLQYLGYYGYPPYWSGAGLWVGGMVPVQTGPGQVNRAELPLGAAARERAIAGAEADRERHRNDDPRLRSCAAVVDYRIHATDGEVGHVGGFLIDDETWTIRYLVVNTSNWWVGHKVLVAPQWISGVHWSDRTVSVDLSREQVKAAPPYDAAATLHRPDEAGLHTHYGRPPYWQPGSALEREI
jgi:hypothetical protein